MAASYKDAINANAAYKVAGKDWTHGVIALVIKADDQIGVKEDTGVARRAPRGVPRLSSGDGRRSQASRVRAFADYARWKQVIHAELEPIKGMMQGKLKLTKGQLPVIVKYGRRAKELVQSTCAWIRSFSTNRQRGRTTQASAHTGVHHGLRHRSIVLHYAPVRMSTAQERCPSFRASSASRLRTRLDRDRLRSGDAH